jgi:tetratricopeptide (TPR) repeat protein
MGLTAANVGDHERAAEAFRRVAETDDLPEAWLNLAAEEVLLGHDAAARDALERASRLGLQRPAVAMAIGELAERLGDLKLADRAYVSAILTVPSLADDPWWRSEAARAARFGAILDAAIAATDELDRWQIPLMAGDPDRARRTMSIAFYGPGSLMPGDVIDAWTGDDAAFQRILAICDAHPLDGTALGWAARLYARRGDDVNANLYRRWAYTASSVAVASGTELRVSDGPKLGRTVAGDVAEFWGTYTYRRPTPWNILVPSLIQLELR